MNLLIDLGNSNIKYCISISGRLNFNHSFVYSTELSASEFQKLLATELLYNINLANSEVVSISNIFVCSVATDTIQLILSDWLHATFDCDAIFVTAVKERLGVINGYSKPSDLGNDRWLTMVYARHSYQSNVCIIDCGTAITVDVVLSNGEHQGGLIAPGYSSQFASLTRDTSIKVSRGDNNSTLMSVLQNTTESAMTRGCLQMQLCFIKETVTQLKAQYGDTLVIVVTGGGAKNLMSDLPNDYIYSKDFLFLSLEFYCSSEMN